MCNIFNSDNFNNYTLIKIRLIYESILLMNRLLECVYIYIYGGFGFIFKSVFFSYNDYCKNNFGI